MRKHHDHGFSCEFAMRIPVARWLISRGLSPICEVASLRNCDLVGIRLEKKPQRIVEMVAVELKLTDIKGVFTQCANLVPHRVSEIWAALPLKIAKENASRFAQSGIGVLGVEADGVERLAEPMRITDRDFSRWKSLTRRRDEHLWRMKNHLMMRSDARAVVRAEQEAT